MRSPAENILRYTFRTLTDGEIFIAYASEADIKPSEDDIIKTVTIDSFSKMKYE